MPSRFYFDVPPTPSWGDWEPGNTLALHDLDRFGRACESGRLDAVLARAAADAHLRGQYHLRDRSGELVGIFATWELADTARRIERLTAGASITQGVVRA